MAEPEHFSSIKGGITNSPGKLAAKHEVSLGYAFSSWIPHQAPVTSLRKGFL